MKNLYKRQNMQYILFFLANTPVKLAARFWLSFFAAVICIGVWKLQATAWFSDTKLEIKKKKKLLFAL